MCVLFLPHRSLSASDASAADPFCVQQGRRRSRAHAETASPSGSGLPRGYEQSPPSPGLARG